MSAVPPLIADLAAHELWRRGELSALLLDKTQQEIHDFVVNNPQSQVYILAARQLGKSFAALVIACEIALKNPGGRINYIAKTLGSAKDITDASMRVIIDSAPDDCKPVYEIAAARWLFPNGAYIRLIGADDDRAVARLRGGRVQANFVDEAGFLDSLDNLLNSVLKPMTRRSPGAKTVLLSTPAYSPGHYSCEVEDAAAAQGALITRDIWSPGLQSRQDKVTFLTQEAQSLNQTLAEYMASSLFRREYLCQRIIEDSLAIVPEFSKVRDAIVIESKRPEFFDLYISVDPGMADKTGILFAIRDFKRATTVIEHELLLTQANTSTIANEIRAVLLEHYPYREASKGKQRPWTWISPLTEPLTCQAPYAAVADDAGKRLCADLYADHKPLSFSPALKDDSAAAINQMRLVVTGQSEKGKLEINPRCKNLVRQLTNAVRTKAGSSEMARSKADAHYDLVASLKYMVRSLEPHHNPFPEDWGFNYQDQARREPEPKQTLSTALLGSSHIGRKLQRK